MPLTIEVFIPSSETQATLTAITGTGTAANPYTITQSGSSQFGTITVQDAANLLGEWQWKVGTRAIGKVVIVAGKTSYPILTTQAAAAAAIAAAGNIDANIKQINGTTVQVDTGGEGIITFNSNATIATLGDTVDANIVQVGGEDIHDDGDGRMEVVGGDGGSAIEGDNEVAVTITDSDSGEPIEGAKIRYYRTGLAGGGTAIVNADGEVIVGLNSATWKWIASASGYENKTGTLVVSADRTHAIELDLSVIEPATEPNKCNVAIDVIDQAGSPFNGVTVSAVVGSSVTGAEQAGVLDRDAKGKKTVNGRAILTLIQGVAYTITFEFGHRSKSFSYTVPAATSALATEDF